LNTAVALTNRACAGAGFFGQTRIARGLFAALKAQERLLLHEIVDLEAL
jgi:hypothetical protein